jgi:phosphoglycolate phosphatase
LLTIAVPVPTERKYLAIGFDMDSTLLETDIDYIRLRRVVHDIFIEAGIPERAIANKDSPITFMGLNYLRDNGRSDDIPKVQKKIRRMTADVEIENAAAARLYEGGRDMLRHLRDRGYRIGVLTRGSRRYATAALTAAGVIDELDALACRDDHDELDAKPSPVAMHRFASSLGVTAKDILYLGDHNNDYKCARDSGAGFIGVLTRYTKEDWFAVDVNIKTIRTVADLTGIIKN